MLVVEAHGGWHHDAVQLLKKLGKALARATGGDDAEFVHHFFRRLLILLMKDNATLLLNRVPTTVEPSVDGYLWILSFLSAWLRHYCHSKY